MAKRSSRRKRRQRKPNVPRYTGPIEPTPTAETSAPTSSNQPKVVKTAAAKQPTTTADFAEEYRYVVGDLRNMMIVTGAMVVLLLTLNFVINY
ncbi:MAG: hypothetical protein GXP42_13615 [Chloroflexi bacterium]|nr:hypothetical protein [Chloroflexota bacterium]